MWTMNCNDHGKEFKMSDHMLHARKLRPLMPRPTASTEATKCSTMAAPHCCCIPNSSICAWNYHQPTLSVHQSKRVFNAEPLVSPRWNPTPEQIQALEDMYRRGLRTPTAEQIQQIAAKLRQFGKIEGKNVFYWFQNHKARERQKWRRQLGSLPEKKFKDVETLEKKESELSKNDAEVEQAKNWATLSNCSTMSEDSVSKHRAVMAESRTNGWAQFDERELQQTSKSKRVKKATLQADLSSYQPHNDLLNTMSTTTAFETSNTKCTNFSTDDDIKMGNESRENQILQLFPPGRNNQTAIRTIEKENEVFTTNINTSFTPIQFFEFLPLKT